MFANTMSPRRLCTSSELSRGFEKLFGEALRETNADLSTYQSGDWQARLAIWEKDQALNLELEVPGVNRDDIELTVDDGVLKIAGERKANDDDERDVRYNERRFGRFERIIRLPKNFDLDSVTAQLADGVLHVTVTKTPESQPKRIDVK